MEELTAPPPETQRRSAMDDKSSSSISIKNEIEMAEDSSSEHDQFIINVNAGPSLVSPEEKNKAGVSPAKNTTTTKDMLLDDSTPPSSTGSASPTRKSIVAEMRASLSKREVPGFVGSLSEFHMKQKASRDDLKIKRGEAARQLHDFRNSGTTPSPNAANRSPVKQKRLAPSDTSAADRAAAAAYLAMRDRNLATKRSPPRRADASSRSVSREVQVAPGSVAATAEVLESKSPASSEASYRTHAADRAAAAAYLAMQSQNPKRKSQVVMLAPMRGISYEKTVQSTPVSARSATYLSKVSKSYYGGSNASPAPAPDAKAAALYSHPPSDSDAESKRARTEPDACSQSFRSGPSAADMIDSSFDSSIAEDKLPRPSGIVQYVPTLWDKPETVIFDLGAAVDAEKEGGGEFTVPEKSDSFVANDVEETNGRPENWILSSRDLSRDSSTVSFNETGSSFTASEIRTEISTYEPVLWGDTGTDGSETIAEEKDQEIDRAKNQASEDHPGVRRDDVGFEQTPEHARIAEPPFLNRESKASFLKAEQDSGEISMKTMAVDTSNSNVTWIGTVLNKSGLVVDLKNENEEYHLSGMIDTDDGCDLSTVTEGEGENDVSKDSSLTSSLGRATRAIAAAGTVSAEKDCSTAHASASDLSIPAGRPEVVDAHNGEKEVGVENAPSSHVAVQASSTDDAPLETDAINLVHTEAERRVGLGGGREQAYEVNLTAVGAAIFAATEGSVTQEHQGEAGDNDDADTGHTETHSAFYKETSQVAKVAENPEQGRKDIIGDKNLESAPFMEEIVTSNDVNADASSTPRKNGQLAVQHPAHIISGGEDIGTFSTDHIPDAVELGQVRNPTLSKEAGTQERSSSRSAEASAHAATESLSNSTINTQDSETTTTATSAETPATRTSFPVATIPLAYSTVQMPSTSEAMSNDTTICIEGESKKAGAEERDEAEMSTVSGHVLEDELHVSVDPLERVEGPTKAAFLTNYDRREQRGQAASEDAVKTGEISRFMSAVDGVVVGQEKLPVQQEASVATISEFLEVTPQSAQDLSFHMPTHGPIQELAKVLAPPFFGPCDGETVDVHEDFDPALFSVSRVHSSIEQTKQSSKSTNSILPTSEAEEIGTDADNEHTRASPNPASLETTAYEPITESTTSSKQESSKVDLSSLEEKTGGESAPAMKNEATCRDKEASTPKDTTTFDLLDSRHPDGLESGPHVLDLPESTNIPLADIAVDDNLRRTHPENVIAEPSKVDVGSKNAKEYDRVDGAGESMDTSKIDDTMDSASEAEDHLPSLFDAVALPEETDEGIANCDARAADGEQEFCQDRDVSGKENSLSTEGLSACTVDDFIDSAVGNCAPSAVSTDEPVARTSSAGATFPVVVNYKSSDYRSFVFAVHKDHGLLLLHCTRKKSKGPHFQLPGGHVDELEFLSAAQFFSDYETQLVTAARMGAARELFEETGIDIRNELDRLKPALLRPPVTRDKHGEVACELNKKLYFYLPISDNDCWHKDGLNDPKIRLTGAMGDCGLDLMLRLSIEHSGFIFEREPGKAADVLKSHSGGTGSKALAMAMANGALEFPGPASVVDSKVRGDFVPSSNSTTTSSPAVLVDYKNEDYRGFVFVVHDAHGLLLLHCTRKAKKGPHFQLPGGHIDEPEFIAAAGLAPSDYKNQLLKAAKMGAARELYEETGLDFRDSLDRLSPAGLRDDDTRNVFGKTVLKCELEKRLYFFVRVTDDDFWSMKRGIPAKLKGTLIRPLDDEGSHLMLKLSHEHSGFRFEKVPAISAELLQKHSGGHGSRALLMAMGIEVEANEDLDVSLDRSAPPQELLAPPTRETGFFECCFGFCLPRDDSRS